MADEMSLQQIADVLGCSRQNVEEKLRGIFRKFKNKLKSKGIYQYSDIAISDAVVEGLRAGNRPRND